MTYPNDGNFLHMILETLRLLAGILLGHDVDSTMVAETWECTVVVSNESGYGCVYEELGMDMKNVKNRGQLVERR